MKSLQYWLYRFKYRNGKSLPLRTPVDVTLELASQCNMRCEYCYHADQDNLPFVKGIMKWEVAQKILVESAQIGVNSVKFNFRGESTINPDFLRITSFARTLAHGSTFIDRLTNSNFKFRTDREDIFEGLSNQTKVKVSYDSFRKKVFEKQRAGGDHDLTTANIDKFYNYPNRKNTKLVIQAVRTKLNKEEDIEYECKRRWPEAEISIRDMVGGRVNKDVSDLEDKKRDPKYRVSCLQAHVRIIFTWEGKALPCCPAISEDVVIGNIHKKTVKNIFNDSPGRILRKKLKDKSAFKVFRSCMNCSSFESYQGFKPNWDS